MICFSEHQTIASHCPIHNAQSTLHDIGYILYIFAPFTTSNVRSVSPESVVFGATLLTEKGK